MTESRCRPCRTRPSLILLVAALLGIAIIGFGRGRAVVAQEAAGTPGPSYLETSSLEPVMDLRRRSRVIEGSRGHQRPGDESVSRAQSSAYALRPGI
ncbi:MAG: hypothetical protein M3R02_24920, partial [Chloroflexota bacterium]|nr:hypothetical protein [Chloroflexota bacterium]